MIASCVRSSGRLVIAVVTVGMSSVIVARRRATPISSSNRWGAARICRDNFSLKSCAACAVSLTSRAWAKNPATGITAQSATKATIKKRVGPAASTRLITAINAVLASPAMPPAAVASAIVVRECLTPVDHPISTENNCTRFRIGSQSSFRILNTKFQTFSQTFHMWLFHHGVMLSGNNMELDFLPRPLLPSLVGLRIHLLVLRGLLAHVLHRLFRAQQRNRTVIVPSRIAAHHLGVGFK